MWRRRSWRFYFGLPTFGFYFHGPTQSPSKQEYLDLLEEYKGDLEKEIKEVEQEIEYVKSSS